jgi:hypothetical protein
MNLSSQMAGLLAEEQQRRLLQEAAAERYAAAAIETQSSRTTGLARLLERWEIRVRAERWEQAWVGGAPAAPALRVEAT